MYDYRKDKREVYESHWSHEAHSRFGGFEQYLMKAVQEYKLYLGVVKRKSSNNVSTFKQKRLKNIKYNESN